MLYTPPASPPGFVAFFDRIAPAQNKFMGLLFNNAANYVLDVTRVVAVNTSVAAVAGAILDVEIRTVTAYTSSTPVTPVALDSSHPLGANIFADTGSTPVTSPALLRRVTLTNEEAGNASVLAWPAMFALGYALFEPDPSPIILRQGEGVAIKNLTNSAVGNLSFAIEFSQRAVT